MSLRTSLSLCAALALSAASPLAEAQIRVAPRFNADLEVVPNLTIELGNRWVYGARIEESGREQIYAGLSWDALRWLQLSGSYRLGAELYHRAVWSSHRVATDVTLSGRWRGFRLSYRLMWRNRWRPSQRVMTYDMALRNRVQLRYHLPKPVFLSVSGEVFSQVIPLPTALDAFRFEAEITGRVKPVDIGFGYRYQFPLMGVGQSYHMIMATVTWHWDRARANRTPEERERRRNERRNRDGRRRNRGGDSQGEQRAPAQPDRNANPDEDNGGES
jgi:hypothetical protein